MDRSRLHALTWTAWAVAGALCVQFAPNPLYISVVFGIAWLCVETHGRRTPLARAFPVMVVLAIVFGLIRVALTALTTHDFGATWITLPSFDLPRVLGGFTVGGAIKDEPVLQSLADAYAIVGFVAVFAAWNAVVSHHEVLRAVPRAFHEAALAVTVAIAFVPSTIATLRAVQEADIARCGGRPPRRGRVRRLVLPVVEGGLERAISLSESMDSRGYGHVAPEASERVGGWCTLGSLGAFAAMIVALVSRADAAAVAAAIVGGALLAAAVVAIARGQRRARYRARRLDAHDWIAVAVAAIAPLVVGFAALRGNATLVWLASDRHAPRADVLVLLGLLPLLVPVVVRPTVPAAEPAPATNAPRLGEAAWPR